MSSYIFQRLLSALPVLLGISFIAFGLGYLSPGDPAELALSQNGLDAPSAEELQAMRQQLGLDKGFWALYVQWLAKVLQGDLGISYITGRSIAEDMWLRLPTTVGLGLLALALAALGGLGGGIACALRAGSLLDRAVKQLTNILLAVPGFWLALILILLFSEILKWLPTSGSETWLHFLLPALVLSLPTMATVCRFMRGALLGQFQQQYFLVARFRGISRAKLVAFYAVPNAALPVIALLGNYFAGILGGSVIAESIFAIPGISSMALEAIGFRDYPVLQAYVLFCGGVLVLVTLAVDLLMAYVDPKIRLGGR